MTEKILVVDDDLETLRLVGLMLQRQGYEIAAASNGEQALREAQAQDPDIILLDVMMPDLDGFEVARRLRANSATADIPILMFTAKGQVDDRVAGYEAGADDYLIKPTHPVELAAHIKALLTRSKKGRNAAAPTPTERGQVMAVLAAKGGLGVSTLTLNLGLSLAQKLKGGVIAAEFRPGNGYWALNLGYPNPEGLNRLLRSEAAQISPEGVEKELVKHVSGLRMLMASSQDRDGELVTKADQFAAILNHLGHMVPRVVVDFGNSAILAVENVLAQCTEAIVVVEPNPLTITRTKGLLGYLQEQGYGNAKLLTVVMINRVRSDVQLTWSQVQESLGQPIAKVITPAPELSFQADLRNLPLMMVQPEGLTAQQFEQLAELVSQHSRNA